MKLVVGLGNPGRQYEGTRHNAGFITLDEWAYQHQLQFNQSEFNAYYLEYRANNEKVFVVKPQTYMNNSGQAVVSFMHYFQIDVSELVVIYDDMDLSVGQVRLRQKGSAGGHNGMKSIIQYVGSDQFKRIRIGVGRPDVNTSVPSHVLSRFHKEEHTPMLEAVRTASLALDYWLGGETFENTMNRYN